MTSHNMHLMYLAASRVRLNNAFFNLLDITHFFLLTIMLCDAFYFFHENY